MLASITEASLRAREMRVRTAALKKALEVLEHMICTHSYSEENARLLAVVLQATAQQQPKGCGEA